VKSFFSIDLGTIEVVLKKSWVSVLKKNTKNGSEQLQLSKECLYVPEFILSSIGSQLTKLNNVKDLKPELTLQTKCGN